MLRMLYAQWHNLGHEDSNVVLREGCGEHRFLLLLFCLFCLFVFTVVLTRFIYLDGKMTSSVLWQLIPILGPSLYNWSRLPFRLHSKGGYICSLG